MKPFNKGDRVIIKSDRSVAYGRQGTVKYSDSLDTTVNVEAGDLPWDRPYTATFSTHNLDLVRANNGCDGSANKQESPQPGSFVEKEVSLTIRLTGQDAVDFESLIRDLDGDPDIRGTVHEDIVSKINSEL